MSVLLRSALTVLCVAAVSAGAAAAQIPAALDKIAATGVIALGVRESSIPLSYAVEKGRYVGYHVDICLQVAEAVKTRLGRPDLKIEMRPVTSQTRIPAVMNGEIDLECGSTTNNADRAALVSFAPTTYVTQVRAAVQADSTTQSLVDLNGLKAATTKGSTSVALMNARQAGSGFKVMEVLGEDHAQSFHMLESGAAQAFIMDDNIVAGLIAASAAPTKWRMIPEFIGIEPIALMHRKNDPDFRDLVAETVKSMMRSGTVDTLYIKWFQSPIPPKGVNLNMPMSDLLRKMIQYPNSDPLEAFRAPE